MSVYREAFLEAAPPLFIVKAEKLVADVRAELLSKPKYRSWVRKMDILEWITKWIYPQGKERAEAFRRVYALLRRLDNIADGDHVLPEGYASATELLEELISFVRAYQHDKDITPRTDFENLLVACFHEAEKFGADITENVLHILSSLQFDAERRKNPRFPFQHELDEYYFKRDIVGVEGICLKLCNFDSSQLFRFEPLGAAHRIFMNLRDFQEDAGSCPENPRCSKGLIPISWEDAQRLNISLENLNELSPGVQEWFREQIAIGMALLEEHDRRMSGVKLDHLVSTVLSVGYYKETKAYFEKKTWELDHVHAEVKISQLPNLLGHCFSALSSRVSGMLWRKKLGVLAEEKKRYQMKSRNLSLCYAGLSKASTPGTYLRAGQAALLCAAYDVATDWRGFDAHAFASFQEMLRAYTAPREENIALDLYAKEQAGIGKIPKVGLLADDGLERGVATLEFLVGMMGLRDEFESRGIDIKETGFILQIVDDVLDIEEDKKNNDLNCLFSPRRIEYLTRLISTDIHRKFDPKSILAIMIEKARMKARLLRLKDISPTSVPDSL